MKFRKLRIAWSVFLSLLCVLVVVLWGRSFRWVHQLTFSSPAGYSVVCAILPGTIGIGMSDDNQKNGWKCNSMKLDEFCAELVAEGTPVPSTFWGFFSRDDGGILVPFWFLLLIVAPTACVSWIPWRFSLRTLLIVMTAVSLALALIVGLSGR